MAFSEKLGNFLSPKTVAIFIQPPGVGFVPLLLTQVNIPSPGRASLDLADTEDFTRRWTVVRNPVERFTAQNRIQEPDSLNLTGMLSANPLSPLFRNIGLARLDRRELLKLKTLITTGISFIVTPERAYADMACLSFRETYNDQTGNGVGLAMRFEEIRIVLAGGVASVFDLDAVLLGAGSTDSLGPQTASAIPDPGGQG